LTGDTLLAATLRRDRRVTLAALLGVAALAWGYLMWVTAQMSAADGAVMPDMPGMDMSAMDMSAMAPALQPWTPVHFLFVLAMWTVMMIGMMTPSVAPMVLIYQQVARQSAARGRAFAPAGWFASGYLLAWTAFSLLASLLQWGLESLALLTPMMASASQVFGGALLIAAGVYQWLPAKQACLAQCRAPLSFIQRHGGFQASARGSVRLGWQHGLYCIGCCWALMTLLFVGGVMNLLWIAVLMLVVLAEKLMPAGRILGRIAGLAAIAAGLWMLFGS
jgi:predicted metal-binding membrane protein